MFCVSALHMSAAPSPPCSLAPGAVHRTHTENHESHSPEDSTGQLSHTASQHNRELGSRAPGLGWGRRGVGGREFLHYVLAAALSWLDH